MKNMCRCKRDYYDNNLLKILFKKGIFYEFEKENDPFLWIIYNKNGDWGRQGCRFHIRKDCDKIVNVESFLKYFDSERKLKLEKLKLFYENMLL